MAKRPRQDIKGSLGEALQRSTVDKAKRAMNKALKVGRDKKHIRETVERIRSPRTNKGKKK